MHRIRRAVCATVFLLAGLLGPPGSAAQDAPSTGASPPGGTVVQSDAPAAATHPLPPLAATVPGHWYGWQILLADLGALGLFIGGTALSSEVSSAYAFVPILGLAVYVVDAPLIEAAQNDPDRIPWSLGRRLISPVVLGAIGIGIGALAGQHSTGGCNEECPLALGGISGFLVGMLGAMVYDWATARTPDRPGAPRAATGGVVWVPVVVVGPRSQSVGLVMRF